MGWDAVRKGARILSESPGGILPQEAGDPNWRFCCKNCICPKGFPGGSDGKETTCSSGDLGSIPGSGISPWRREWLPSPVFLPGESHGQRSLAGYTVHGVARVRHDLTTKPPQFCLLREILVIRFIMLSVNLENVICSLGLLRSVC